MKSKKVWVTLLVSLLVITLGFSIQSVKADSNNPIGNSGGLTIYSPVNTTYNSNFLSLRLSFGSGGVPATINYSLDGKYSGPVPLFVNDTSTGFHIITNEDGFAELPELSDGSHQITITLVVEFTVYSGNNPPGAPFKETTPGSGDWVAKWVNTIDFSIDSSPSPLNLTPTVAVFSIENNQTFNIADVPLNFTVDTPVSQLTYSLDENNNVSISGNTTLTNLPNGTHNLIVYALSDAGVVGASQTINFTVADTSTATLPVSQSFPATLVIAVFMGLLVTAVLAVLVYAKWGKRQPTAQLSQLGT